MQIVVSTYRRMVDIRVYFIDISEMSKSHIVACWIWPNEDY